MTSPKSDMLAEAAEAPEAIRRLLERQRPAIEAAVQLFTRAQPSVVTTAARGSSDHAATFFKYLMETELGLPVASIGPSVASIYQGELLLQGAVHVTVSQSGASPDLVAVQRAARAGGARTIAVVNVAESPLAAEADVVLALEAGPERSVAATKTFITSAAALSALVAGLSKSARLADALGRLPDAMAALESEAEASSVKRLAAAQSLYTVGRGPAFALAGEMALKFKELAGIHAEGCSLAEIMHGPLSLVGPGFPILGIVPDDGAMDHHRQALERLAGLGADLHLFTQADLPGTRYPIVGTGHPAMDALSAMLPFYRMAHSVTVQRKRDPETPRNLKKVTLTA